MIDKGDILIVDDTHASLKLLSDILMKEGHQVRPADSGELALSSVAAKLPELILLDIRMPGMDGFEVLRRLKAREESRNIPIIFLSASVGMDERIEGLKLGAVDFVSKPFQAEELLARVQTQVELSHLRVRLEKQAVELRLANEQLQIDINERKQAEEILRTSESRARAMFQAIPDMIFRLDRHGIFLDYKADIKDIYAQSYPTIIGKRNRDITPPEFADLIERKIHATLDTKTLQTFEYQLPLPGSGVKYYEARMVDSGADEVTAIVRDITERKRVEEALVETSKEREKLIQELQYALDNIKTLEGLIPICSNCKKIRDDQGFWNQVEGYIGKHTDAKFSHGICPDCAKKLYGNLYEKVIEEQKKKNK